jgi:release factor H-coupled RctB family protein
MSEIKIVRQSSSWIEGAAEQQLKKMAELPGMVRAVGMPDLHPGQGCPNGAVFITENHIYPHLIGSDIGCGIGLWSTTIQQLRPERLEKKLKGLETGIANPETVLASHGVPCCGYEHSLGTWGHGNHFAEILVFDDIADAATLNNIIPYDQHENAVLLVHSGSRGFGEKILHEHTAKYQDKGLSRDNPDFDEYVNQHRHAIVWARANREVIAGRMLDCLGAQGQRVLDSCHNFLQPVIHNFNPESPLPAEANLHWVHRKGAIPSDRGPVVIPGSRGTHSYLVMPVGNDEETGRSLSHGAGRKMSRIDARSKNGGISEQQLVRTRLGSYVICEDKMLLREEAPNAYKQISQVIDDLVAHNLIRVIARMKPIVTYKTRRVGDEEVKRSKKRR